MMPIDRLREVPAEILRECQALQTINLHQNPLTIEQLRETDEFRQFDVRRRAKYDKQVINCCRECKTVYLLV